MACSRTAIHLNREPFLRRTLIHEIATRFGIPDLAPSLAHFHSRVVDGNRSVYMVGGRRHPVASTTSLPFQKLEVWQGLRIQMRDYHNLYIVQPPQTICALPPTGKWCHGRFDPVFINIKPDKKWPESKMSGSVS